MTVALDDIPFIEGEELGLDEPELDGYLVDRRFGRRSLMKIVMGAGAFLGFSTMGLFKSARGAGAMPPNYIEHGAGTLSGSYCGSYDPDTWYSGDNNQNGWYDPGGDGQCFDDACVGAMDVYMGAWYCSTCWDQDQPNASDNPFQWHVSGDRNSGGLLTYGDYSPDICYNSAAGFSADAWRWEISSCNGCSPAVYRCHDGWKQDGGGSHFSICQGLVVCNGVPYTAADCP